MGLMKKKRGLSFIELVVVLIIVGIFSTLAIINYTPYRERVLDKEAIASSKLMQQAQRIYMMDYGAYYPMGGSTSETNIAAINKDLKLFLNTDEQHYWDYVAYSTGTSTATRSGRTWTSTIDAKDPVCTGSCL